ncbi:hypothetical protein D1BOALGB6SA_1239 [Olavius sp. associated proteobacterium Delta 1]|nr:hypothetical protein D1BOALGB6SA_1239 [Olavius sp. associated proteobacterium Delta 1]
MHLKFRHISDHNHLMLDWKEGSFCHTRCLQSFQQTENTEKMYIFGLVRRSLLKEVSRIRPAINPLPDNWFKPDP